MAIHVKNRIKYNAGYTTIHPIRSIQKVKDLVVNFDNEMAVPILVGNHGCLLNGTHRYHAYLIRKNKGFEDNFKIVDLSDLQCWVGDGIREHIEANTDTKFIDIDSFWRDNWEFSDYFMEG